MRAAKLISLLSKIPPESEVAWQDHDAEEGTISAHISGLAKFKSDGSQDKKWTVGIDYVLHA